jgi:membrane-bound lytic murein transglycosylase MltF
MQIMPKTGRELGVGDVHKADPNVHAGAKYMAQLMDEYFNSIQFDDQNRNLFAFAAYNAKSNRCVAKRTRTGSSSSRAWK